MVGAGVRGRSVEQHARVTLALYRYHECFHTFATVLLLQVANSSFLAFLARSRCPWWSNNPMSITISLLLLLFTLLVSPNAKAQHTLFPPAVPLAVRSPYLSSWQYLTNGTIIGQSWPTTFNGSSVCRPRIFSWS